MTTRPDSDGPMPGRPGPGPQTASTGGGGSGLTARGVPPGRLRPPDPEPPPPTPAVGPPIVETVKARAEGAEHADACGKGVPLTR